MLQSLTVLTEDDDDVPGSKFEKRSAGIHCRPAKTVVKVQGLKLSGKRDDLVKRVSDCMKCGNHHTLDASIDNGKWFAAKVLVSRYKHETIG